MSESITQKQEQLALEPALTNQVVNQIQEVNTMSDHQTVRETEQNMATDVTDDRQTSLQSAAGPVLPVGKESWFHPPHWLTLKAMNGKARFQIGKSQALTDRDPQDLKVGEPYTWHGDCYVKNCGNTPITYEQL